MAQTLTSLHDLDDLPFDEIIDVRSPAEFAEDHIPGAINLPALSNEERARVGTIYVQQDRFLARKIGAALVARNVANHLEGPLSDRPGGWRPLVHCWRGGQRSGSFATILGQIGWRADMIDGGYQAYRRLVFQTLYETPFAGRVTLIDGGTGTAKTRLLDHLTQQGAQVLDLEAMAQHRGSLFGLVGDTQPSQKAFESLVAMDMTRLDPNRPVFVEAESSKIGRLNLPPMLWQEMIRAPRLHLTAPLAARAAHTVASYDDMTGDPARLTAVLARLVPYHGHKQVDAWQALAAEGGFATLAAQLITTHYDPRYRRISRKDAPAPTTINLPDLSDDTLSEAATQILSQTV